MSDFSSWLGLEGFLRPLWMAALLGAPLIGLIGAYGLRRRRRERALLVAERHQPRFLPGYAPGRATARIVCAVLASFFLAFSLLGPVNGYSLREVRRKGLDIVLCVDTSRSMLVQDVNPDRLTRARREVRGLLDRLQGDRAAVLAFAGGVRRVAPLTHDRTTLASFVEDLNVDENLVGGTNLGGAIDEALDLLDGRRGAHEVIVLITDGEDLEGTGLEAAQRAAEKGIRVFVVGMGSEGGGKIPDGRRGFVRDETGKEVVSALADASLRAIAGKTDGAYISSSMSVTPLEELYDKRLTKLEGRELVSGKERVPHDQYWIFAAIAMVCMLIEVSLRERRDVKGLEL